MLENRVGLPVGGNHGGLRSLQFCCLGNIPEAGNSKASRRF
jgi:hypothetical protein